VGWKGESRRHSLARRGIKTVKGNFKSNGSYELDIDKLNLYKRLPQDELDKKMEYLFYQDVDCLESWVAQYLEEMFMDDDPEEFELVDVVLWGSYTKNEEKKGSDLDFLMTYNGTARDDGLFNWINHENPDGQLEIMDRFGNTVKIDISPQNLYNDSTTEQELINFSNMEQRRIK